MYTMPDIRSAPTTVLYSNELVCFFVEFWKWRTRPHGGKGRLQSDN